MRVIDLIPAYRHHVLTHRNVAAYEASYPAFFDHYRALWSGSTDHDSDRGIDAIDLRFAEITGCIPSTEESCNELGIDLEDVGLLLMVGSGVANGHAYGTDRGFEAWLALECFDDLVTARTFLAHEIAHAWHYSVSRGFYFESLAERIQVGRQVMTEGIATRLSMLVADVDEGVALWGGYLDRDKRERWISSCRNGWSELASESLANWSESPRHNGLFTLGSGLPRQNRGGYYVGLRTVLAIERSYSTTVTDLARLPRPDLERLFVEELGRAGTTTSHEDGGGQGKRSRP